MDADDIAYAQREANNPETVDCLFLVKNGVPFDVAFSLDPAERLAWVVIMGTFEGGRFNWGKLQWEKPSP